MQVDSAKQELRAAQLSAEDAARRESAANTQVQEMEALLRGEQAEACNDLYPGQYSVVRARAQHMQQ